MRRAELVVIGAGPAGLRAAIEAGEAGVEVLLVDEHERAGGQLFKQIHKFFGSQEHFAGKRGFDIGEELLARCCELGVVIRLSTVAYGIFPDKVVGLACQGHVEHVQAERLVLAAGAQEKAVAFPGWTLPGVMGPGAAQTLLHIHRVLPGRRALMVGSGNVGLIVAYQLLQAGAEVAAVVEARNSIGGYLIHAEKLTRQGVPIYLRHTVLRAEGEAGIERAIIGELDDAGEPARGRERALDVDCLCLAVGLSPLTELAEMAGCQLAYVPELGGHVPVHDDNMETTVPGIYVAGDLAGIEEASMAMDEGRLAGVAAAESLRRLGPDEAKAHKEAIRARLRELRLGPSANQVASGDGGEPSHGYSTR